MKIRRIVIMLLCVITIASMFFLAACGGNSTYTDAFNSYMKAQDDLNSQQIVDLLPPQYYNYQISAYMNGRHQSTEEEAKERVLLAHPTILEVTDYLKFYPIFDLKDDYSYTYKITDEYKASSKQVDEFNAYVKEKLDFKDKAQEIVLIRYEYSIRQNGVILDVFDGRKSSGVCIKYGGEWYFVSPDFASERMWVDRRGLLIDDGIEWIYEWL